MKPVTDLPYYSDGTLKARIDELMRRHPEGSAYVKRLDETWQMLDRRGYPTENYAMHLPIIFNKEEMLKTFEEFPQGEMWRSVYGNHWIKPVVKMPDCKIYDIREIPPEGAAFLSTTDITFEFGEVGKVIREAFPDKCKYED